MADQKPSCSVALPEPSRPALTFRGKTVTPQHIIELFKEGLRAKKNSRNRILKVRAMRRKENSSLVKLPPKWIRLHPEAAAWARTVLHERITLERDLIAKVGSVEPEFICEPLGFLESANDMAEDQEAFLEEWKLRNVPIQTFAGKGVEDGEFARITLPTDLDLDGCPDFFEYISKHAYDEMDDDQKSTYQQDESDRRGRYVKQQDGKPERAERYQALSLTADEQKRPAAEREKLTEKRDAEAQARHDTDVAQYILRRQLEASATRIIPALDCSPIFKRGRRRDRWELAALVERTLYEPYELLEDVRNVRYHGMGDRLLVPQGYRDDGSVFNMPASDVGVNGQVYVYTIYFPLKADDGKTHLVVCSTIGGAGTWDGVSGEENDRQSVTTIDLTAEYGIEANNGSMAPFVTYHGGLHTEDDDPDHYWQPYMWAIIDLINAIEGTDTANRAAVAVNAYTGHIYTPDANLPDEAIVDTGGNLIRPKIPGPGEMEPAAGSTQPFQQAVIGSDAWRLGDRDRMSLDRATAIDQTSGGKGESGHQLLVEETLGQVAKRHNRDCVKEATVACGESALRIWHAIYERYKIRWPIRTTQERPVKGETREGRDLLQYDPAWVADGQFNLAADYPEEFNLAQIDLEADLADRGYGNSDRVLAAMGERNPKRARLKATRDRLLRNPAIEQLQLQRVAKRIGDRDMQEIIDLQAAQQAAPAQVPGLGPVPMAAMNGPGEQRQGATGGGQQGPGMAASVRGGVQGAQVSGDRATADMQSAVAGGGIAA